MIGAECHHGIMHFLEGRIFGPDLGIGFFRRVEAGFHDVGREGPEFGAKTHQLFQCFRIAGIIFCLHVHVRGLTGGFHNRLIGGGKLCPFCRVDHGVQHGAAFPPAGIVIERGNFVEAKLLVVVGTNPFGGIDHAFFKVLVDLRARQLLWHHAKLGNDLATEAADAHFNALQIGNGLDFLAEPAAHLRARVATGESDEVLRGIELVHQVHAAAIIHPGVLHAAVEAEGNGSCKGVGGILAPVIIGRRVAHLHIAFAHLIGGFEGRGYFPAGENLDGKLAICRLAYGFGKSFCRAINCIKALGKAGSHAPFHFWHCLRNGGGCQCWYGCSGYSRFSYKSTTVHLDPPFAVF